MSDHILSEITGGVLALTFDRAEKKNAITDEMYAALADHLERAHGDPDVRVVLIRSRGDAFTAGNDMASFARQSTGPVEASGPSSATRFIRTIAGFEKPIVAGVRGRAVGIGLTMLLHCDLVIIAQDAKLSAPFVNLALVPEAASSRLLVARIGHVRAFAMFAGDEVVDGETAAQWGLANRAIASEAVDAEALAAARLLATRPRQSLMATKRLMRDQTAISEQIALEMAEFSARLASPEAREAFQAFSERRPADFANV